MLGKNRREESFIESTPSTVCSESNTFIGENISIEGSIQGKENLVIEGSVKGNVELEAHHLTVGTKGQIEGEIHADNVTVKGRLTGNIKASGKVEITREADFNGEIKAKNLSVEDGAYLKAVIELEPQKKTATIGKLPDQKPTAEEKTPIALASESKTGKDS
jgi:cytoskeletal protein CcmA (bactofilin family)